MADALKQAARQALAPCPFCGSNPKLEDSRTIWIVRCECGACVLGERAPEPESEMPDEYWDRFEQSAIDAWNRRAALSHPEPEAVQVPLCVRTAPERIWLQADINGMRADDPFENDGVTWCAESVGGAEVEYVRADLAAPQPPAQAEPAAPADMDARIVAAAEGVFDHQQIDGFVPRMDKSEFTEVVGAAIAAFVGAPTVAVKAPAAPQAGEATAEMKAAVRWAPSSAYWSRRLREFFGEDARDGIRWIEQRLMEAQKRIAALEASQPMSREGMSPLAARCYAMSERHLSGWRLVIGFERLEDAQKAQEWVALLPRAHGIGSGLGTGASHD